MRDAFYLFIEKNIYARPFFRLFIKPGIQERGTKIGESGEHRECSLGFWGMSKFKIPQNVYNQKSLWCLVNFHSLYHYLYSDTPESCRTM